jgi:exodeoxyribonuclease VII large subunit
MSEEHVYTVSELNRSARGALETEFADVWLKGEVSEIKRAASGHLYFTLKDEDSEISAVRFRSRTSALIPVDIERGTNVLALGRLTVYEPRGRYQFIASVLQPLGAGALQAAIERLKARLNEEGLFDVAHKRPLPPYPVRIGVITSTSGAALRDIRSVLSRRWPVAELYLFPTSVQGASAPLDLVSALDAAIRFAKQIQALDVLILGRGGGSAEDLAAFSDERVIRAVFGCPIPVISAVGHEIDFAISDFVADLRAPTPASAAELVAPDCRDVCETVSARVSWMAQIVAARLTRRSQRLRANLRGYLFRLPGRKLETLSQRLDGLVEVLTRGASQSLALRAQRLAHFEDVLRLSDPRFPLHRGYSLTFLKGSAVALRDVAEVGPGSEIETRLATGRLHSRVEEVIDE